MFSKIWYDSGSKKKYASITDNKLRTNEQILYIKDQNKVNKQ